MERPHTTPALPVERFFEFSLLGLVASGSLAVAGSGYLDAPTIALICVGLLLRAFLVATLFRISLSGRMAAAVALACVGFYTLDSFFLSGAFLAATVHMAFFLAFVQILIARTAGDCFRVKVIAFLELLAASILSPRLNFFVCLALFVLFGIAAFMAAEVRGSARASTIVSRVGGRRISVRLAGVTLAVVLGTLLVSALLFFVLPRTARAAFHHLGPTPYRLSGFSHQVTLGAIGEIKKLDASVMHVKIASRTPLPPLKWRGSALVNFDGRRWFNPVGGDQILKTGALLLQLADNRQRLRQGVRINYDVQLKPAVSDTVFFTGVPEFLLIGSRRVIRTATGSYRPTESYPDGLRYGGYSYIETEEPAPSADPLPDAERRACLALPRLDPRIAPLVHRLTAGRQGAIERARAIEAHLRANYGYTLELPPAETADPLACFLFERRRGHCEYFASAMAVLLRTVGVPTRVATGFQSGVYNGVSGWYLIRASDAHSWVEAYLPGRGWTTFDPTPPGNAPHAASLWSTLALYLDAADTFWQDWVLNYNLDRQLTLASRMEQSGRSLGLNGMDRARATVERWRDAALAWARAFGPLLLALVVSLAAGRRFGPRLARRLRTGWRVRRVRQGEVLASDATLLYQRMLAALHRRGFEKPPWQTATEFAASLPASPTASRVMAFTRAYHDLRFGGRLESAPRMMALLGEIETRPPA